MFTMIGALCKDPRHFMNQHDLLSMLQHHESNDDQIFALSTLAVCSMGEHLRKRQIRQLIDISLESNQNIGKHYILEEINKKMKEREMEHVQEEKLIRNH